MSLVVEYERMYWSAGILTMDYLAEMKEISDIRSIHDGVIIFLWKVILGLDWFDSGTMSVRSNRSRKMTRGL